MAGSGAPDWNGLLKWSISHTDGTAAGRPISDEDKKWFMEAMQAQTVDVVKRMKEITMVMNTPQDVLESNGVTVEDLEGMLEELQDHVESIDMANDLNAIGGLVPLLSFLKSPHPSIRARAAEVVSTIVQNNPRSQEMVMDERGLELLLSNFTSDVDLTARTKALGAISSLIRNNKAATTSFRLANGYAGLRDALASEHSKLQRKGLSVLQYLLLDNPNDFNVAVELGFIRSLTNLASNSDTDIRQAALQALFDITNKSKDTKTHFGTICEQLKPVLETQVGKVENMNEEDLEAIKEERFLLDSLWKLCFDESSSLRKKGLLVMPSDSETAPDVASQLFEPALRALATSNNQTTSQQSNGGNSQPLLLGPGAPSRDACNN